MNKKLLALILATVAIFGLALRAGALWQGERSSLTAAQTFQRDVWTLDVDSHFVASVPQEANAAHWAKAGSAALVLSADEAEALHSLRGRGVDAWQPSDFELVRPIIRRNELSLELLHRIAELSDSSFELDYSQAWGVEIPNLMTIQQAGFLLLAEMRLALGSETSVDFLRARRAAMSLRGIARACQKETPFILQLVGLRLEQLSWTGIEDLVGRGADEALLRQLMQPLLETTASEQMFRGLGFETALVNGTGAKELANAGLFHPRWLKILAPWLKGVADAQMMDYYSRFARLYKEYPLAEMLSHSIDQPPGFPASNFGMVLNLAAKAEEYKSIEARRALAGIALQVYLDARAGGGYPQDLSSYPAASVNVYTGRPLAYRVQDDGTAVLEVPGGVELNRLFVHPEVQSATRLSWRLPAL